MTGPPTLADLMADPGELSVSCLDCHYNTTMPVASLLPRYAAETPFPEVWEQDARRCSTPSWWTWCSASSCRSSRRAAHL